MSEIESVSFVDSSKKSTKVNIVFLILALIFIQVWLIVTFLVGLNFLYSSDEEFVIATMTSLYATGSFVLGVLFGFSFNDMKLSLIIAFAAGAITAVGLSIIAAMSVTVLMDSQIAWIGLGGTTATIIITTILTSIIRILIKNAQKRKNQESKLSN